MYEKVFACYLTSMYLLTLRDFLKQELLIFGCPPLKRQIINKRAPYLLQLVLFCCYEGLVVTMVHFFLLLAATEIDLQRAKKEYLPANSPLNQKKSLVRKLSKSRAIMLTLKERT